MTRDSGPIAAAIVGRLRARAPGATCCPSEIARALAPDDWRSWMEPVRAAARALADAGLVEITQRGRVVDGHTARGPIRLRLARRGDGRPR
jgi:hypothetical protein